MHIIKAKLKHADIVAEIHSKAWRQAYKGIFPSNYLEEESVLKRKLEFLDSCKDDSIFYEKNGFHKTDEVRIINRGIDFVQVKYNFK